MWELRQKTSVIYNPGITAEVRKKAKAPLEHPCFKPHQPPVVLSVGRLNVQTDYRNMLQAFNKVKEQRSARLLILGNGGEQQMLEK